MSIDKTKPSFEAIVSPHLDQLYRLAYRLSGKKADAEDLVQDLLVKLYSKQEELVKVEQLRPWLSRVLYRLFIDKVRKDKRSPLKLVTDNFNKEGDDDYLDQLPCGKAGPADVSDHEVSQKMLLEAFEHLNEDHKAVLTLHDIEGYTLEEIHQVIGCPVGTLKSRIHRARAHLRKLLVNAGY